MRHHSSNGWFLSTELVRAVTAIAEAATTVHIHWINHPSAKYVQIRVDQRTGDFVLLDQSGDLLPHDVICDMFPNLREDV
jgi:hypothetical protein